MPSSIKIKNSQSDDSSLDSLFIMVMSQKQASNKYMLDEDVVDESPVAYRTPAEILDELNIDKRTHIDLPTQSIGTFTGKTGEGVCERTLAIIKPNAMKFRTEIEKRIIDEGFEILTKRTVHLSPEQASEFYASYYGTLGFPTRIVYMSSAPITVYVLAREKAVGHWLKVIGPENVAEAELFWPSSLRGVFGKCDNIDNAVHGSADHIASKSEIRFFFPHLILEPISQDEVAEEYLNKNLNPILSEGLAELLRVKPIDPIIWFAEWLLWHNPNRPKLLPEAIARTKT